MPSPATTVQYVLDGGALLHRIQWPSGENFDAICSRYVQHVTDKYRSPVIVFDGYQNGPSTKDITHCRRAKSGIAAEVRFTGDMICSMKKDVFLFNKTNKQRFITLLSSHLQQTGIVVVNAEADANVQVSQTAIDSAASNETVLVGDDTDLLILLCCNSKSTNCELYFRPEPKSNSQRAARCWNIKQVQRVLGDQICDNLLFTHALLGCDTTSRVFGIGKPVVLKKLRSNTFFREQAAVFQDPDATPEDIRNAGENALVCLYYGKPGDKLNTIRVQHFHRKVSASTSCVQPRTLPPTSAAAKYHSLRVYHQVQQWRGVHKRATEWGWRLKDDKMLPVATDLQPAPEYLLEAINCNCKTDCSSRRCSCVKFGLYCSPACGQCKGLLCCNIEPPEEDCDSDDE